MHQPSVTVFAKDVISFLHPATLIEMTSNMPSGIGCMLLATRQFLSNFSLFAIIENPDENQRTRNQIPNGHSRVGQTIHYETAAERSD